MPMQDYTYFSESWRVVVLIKPHMNAETLQELPGPYMTVDMAEYHIEQIRTAINNGMAVALPWLALGPGQLVGAYLSA